MALKINVTWPRHLPQVCISIDCRDLEPISRKATRSGNHIVIDGAFGQGNRVCDDDRYRIDRQSNSPLECCDCLTAYEQTLVILLESPHKDEYFANCIDRPIAPALGTTGHNVQDYLMEVIHGCPDICQRLGQETTRIIIANPIQFQTSLAAIIRVPRQRGESNEEKKEREKREKKIRDAVWKALWDLPAIRDEFRGRLERYHPDFIINACTHDLECTSYYRAQHDNKCKMQCRKRKIRDFLKQKFPCAHIYAAAVHPVSWNDESRRGLDLIQERRRNRPGTSTVTN